MCKLPKIYKKKFKQIKINDSQLVYTHFFLHLADFLDLVGKMIKQAARKWDISVGLALIRSPVIAPEMTEVERGYDKTTAIEEHERSLMSDFELRKIKDQE